MIQEVEEKTILIEGWAREGLSQQQIADNLGIGLSTLKKYKNKSNRELLSYNKLLCYNIIEVMMYGYEGSYI